MQQQKSIAILGGILLVIGNVIGAGILALPMATAALGLPLAIAALILFWLLMMLGAHYFLEANLALPTGSNLISMARATLGKYGVAIAWICNLIVMYSLIAAYLSGGGDLIKMNFHYIHINLPLWFTTLIFLLIFGFIVSRGMKITDYTNRLLMLFKIALFIVTIIGLSAHFDLNNISLFKEDNLNASLLIIVLTSFGFATLIPSLRNYYQSDVKKIKKIIFYGTFIPLVIYIIWIASIFLILPYPELKLISASTRPVSNLQLALSNTLHITWITQSTNIFSSICIITSFLANSVSFTDFIADGFHLAKNNRKSHWVYIIAFLPTLLTVIFYQKAFLMGLSIAGFLAVIQLLILPGLITWRLRYTHQNNNLIYSVFGGKILLSILLLISLVILLCLI